MILLLPHRRKPDGVTGTLSRESVNATRLFYYEMIEAIKLTLENTPPELAADVMERGIVLTGGGALIKGLDKLITETTKIPTHVAEYPLDCVAIGTGKALDNIKELIESSK